MGWGLTWPLFKLERRAVNETRNFRGRDPVDYTPSLLFGAPWRLAYRDYPFRGVALRLAASNSYDGRVIPVGSFESLGVEGTK